jgi:hypothetical protein
MIPVKPIFLTLNSSGYMRKSRFIYQVGGETRLYGNKYPCGSPQSSLTGFYYQDKPILS